MLAGRKRRVSILCHTVAGNALGRAWVFAELLAPDFEVELVVAARRTDRVWAPLRGKVEGERRWFIRTLPAFRWHARGIARELVRGDLLIAVKPRLHSYGLALAARAVQRRPLLLDIDDWELGFFSPWVDVAKAPLSWLSAASNLHTRWYFARTGQADAISVSSTYLQQRYGGMIIPHARRAEDFQVAGVEPSAVPLVMFAGTPRQHKGLADLLHAFRRVQLPGARLCIVGAAGDAGLARLAQADPRVLLEPPVPLSELPRKLAQAWLIAIPQRDEAPSAAQLPAKLIDGMALGKAVLSTAIGDIPKWLAGDAGVVVPPNDPAAFGDAMQALLGDRARLQRLGENARQRFLELGSYDAVRPRLLALVEALLAGRAPPALPLPFE